MKKVLLLSVVALGMLSSCSCSGLKVRYSKTDPQAMHERDLKGFERIEMLGSLDVKYQQADSFSVRVEAPVEVLHDVFDGNITEKRYLVEDGLFQGFIASQDYDIRAYPHALQFFYGMLGGLGLVLVGAA